VTNQAFVDILAAFPKQYVLVVGDLMLDEYISGEVSRISPEAPVPVIELGQRRYVGGGAANVAANAVSLNGQVLLGGVVGGDQPAEQLRATLAELKVDTSGFVVDVERPTTLKTRIVALRQQIVRLDYEQRKPLSAVVESQLLQWIESNLPQAGVCIVSDYAKGVVSVSLTERVIALAQVMGKPVVIDPKGTDYAKYRQATVVTPNIHEAEQVVRRKVNSEAELLAVGRELLNELGGAALLITRGSQGMSLFRDDLPPLHIPSAARSVFDVTGAGDTVVGALGLAFAAGASLEQAAWLANRAAGIVVGKAGTATVTLDELRSSLELESL
jgi:rfaE bifunctional protein kinase chain/domain